LLLSLDCGVNSFQETAHLFHALERDELDAVLVDEKLEFLAWTNAQRLE